MIEFLSREWWTLKFRIALKGPLLVIVTCVESISQSQEALTKRGKKVMTVATTKWWNKRLNKGTIALHVRYLHVHFQPLYISQLFYEIQHVHRCNFCVICGIIAPYLEEFKKHFLIEIFLTSLHHDYKMILLTLSLCSNCNNVNQRQDYSNQRSLFWWEVNSLINDPCVAFVVEIKKSNLKRKGIHPPNPPLLEANSVEFP